MHQNKLTWILRNYTLTLSRLKVTAFLELFITLIFIMESILHAQARQSNSARLFFVELRFELD